MQVISDLLKPEAQNLVVREDRRRGVHVEGLSEWVVRNPGEVGGGGCAVAQPSCCYFGLQKMGRR